MRHPFRARSAHAQRLAQIAKDLAIPRGSTLRDLQQQLTRVSGRAVHVSSAELVSGSPSGFWFRRNGEDYLFCERHTSPFHQASIVLHLAAHALLTEPESRLFDPRLTPTAGIELANLILGDIPSSTLSDVEADDFAFLALRSAGRSVNWLKARRSLRRIEPLRCALVSAVPQAARALGSAALPGATRRLCQAVIEVREASLALQPFRDPAVGAAATKSGCVSGLTGRDLAATVEAAVLAGAIRRRHVGEPARTEPDTQVVDSPLVTADLASEVEWLIRLSRAFASHSIDGQSSKGQGSGD